MDQEAINNLRTTSMDLLEMMSVVLEAVDGYKAKCEEHGYSPTAAEGMAEQFHMHMLAKIFEPGQ